MKTLIYLNNFPRENAVKGQEFKGNSDLKKELLDRNIIGTGEVTAVGNVESKLEAQIKLLEEKNLGLETQLKDLGDREEVEKLKNEIEILKAGTENLFYYKASKNVEIGGDKYKSGDVFSSTVELDIEAVKPIEIINLKA